MAELGKTRPGGNMRLFDALQYYLPPAGVASILHRASGVLMALLLPFVVWMFDASISSEASFDAFASVFSAGVGVVPGWIFKLIALALIAAYVFHVSAGVRHLWMDATHDVGNRSPWMHVSGTGDRPARSSALAVFAVAIVLTVALGAKLFGLY